MDIKIVTPDDFDSDDFKIEATTNKVKLKNNVFNTLNVVNTYDKIWTGNERYVDTEITLGESLLNKEFFIVVTQDQENWQISPSKFGRASNVQVGLNGDESPYTVYINKFATDEATFEYRLIQNGTKMKLVWNPNNMRLIEIWVKRQQIQNIES